MGRLAADEKVDTLKLARLAHTLRDDKMADVGRAKSAAEESRGHGNNLQAAIYKSQLELTPLSAQSTLHLGRELGINLDDYGSSISQHLGHSGSDIVSVVLHADDCVGAGFSAMTAHQVKGFHAGLFA